MNLYAATYLSYFEFSKVCMCTHTKYNPYMFRTCVCVKKFPPVLSLSGHIQFTFCVSLQRTFSLVLHPTQNCFLLNLCESQTGLSASVCLSLSPILLFKKLYWRVATVLLPPICVCAPPSSLKCFLPVHAYLPVLEHGGAQQESYKIINTVSFFFFFFFF